MLAWSLGYCKLTVPYALELQKAFLFLTLERSFQKQWVSLSLIESALCLRYSFGNHYNASSSDNMVAMIVVGPVARGLILQPSSSVVSELLLLTLAMLM